MLYWRVEFARVVVSVYIIGENYCECRKKQFTQFPVGEVVPSLMPLLPRFKFAACWVSVPAIRDIVL